MGKNCQKNFRSISKAFTIIYFIFISFCCNSYSKNNYYQPKKIIKRVAVIGNSITLHGPNDNIGWKNTSGMAASSTEKDYIHIFLEKISLQQNKIIPELLIENGYGFETQLSSFLINSFKNINEFHPDIIILQVGDNVKNINDFRDAYKALMGFLSKNESKIICISTWWEDKVKDDIIKDICYDNSAIYINISDLSKNTSNVALSERKFINNGVANHPGDKGMKNIADRIYNNFKKYN